MINVTLDPTSTREDWRHVFQFVDDDTNEPLDLTGATIVLELRDRLSGHVVATATGPNGISIIDTGTFQVSVNKGTMQTLRADMYEIGGIYTLNGVTRQFIIGLLPVLDGIVKP